jgi:hypothetical protein
VIVATPCSECVSWRSCRPGSISEPFGCESWADDQGRRALPDQLETESFEDPDPEPFRPAAPFVPDLGRGEAPSQGVLAMTDAGPLFAGCPEVRR